MTRAAFFRRLKAIKQRRLRDWALIARQLDALRAAIPRPVPRAPIVVAAVPAMVAARLTVIPDTPQPTPAPIARKPRRAKSSGRPGSTGQEPGSTDTTARLRCDSDPRRRADTAEQALAPAGCDGPEDTCATPAPAPAPAAPPRAARPVRARPRLIDLSAAPSSMEQQADSWRARR